MRKVLALATFTAALVSQVSAASWVPNPAAATTFQKARGKLSGGNFLAAAPEDDNATVTASSGAFGSVFSTPGAVSGKQFSYIIVGGGTAGLTVATRLSEDSSVNVLVLEAGPAHLNDPLVLTPQLVGAVYGNLDYDWVFNTVPQPKANNVALNWTMGRMLGGCSGLNAMIWDRSSKPEYDNLATLTGDSSWSFNALQPYFERPEKFTPASREFQQRFNFTTSPSNHGDRGPIKTTFNNFVPSAELPYQPAALSQGIPRIADPYAGVTTGTWRTAVSVDPDARTRSYVVQDYLLPNKNRRNLFVVTEAVVQKINFSRSSSGNSLAVASGVTFLSKGKTYTVSASKEVIVSGGAVGSPKVLEISGIGDPARLSKFKIPTVVNLPTVGENLQDHILTPQSYKLKPGVDSLDRLSFDESFNDQAQSDFARRPSSGPLGWAVSTITFLNLELVTPLAKTILSQATSALAKTKRTPGMIKQQQLQLSFMASKSSSTFEMLVEPMHLTPDAKEEDANYITIFAQLQLPFSRGSVHIASADMAVEPLIDPQYFSIDADLTMLVEAAKFIRNKIAASVPWKSVIEKEAFPGPSVQTDAQWGESIKGVFSTQGHGVGTCSMQPRDQGGVVDSKFKVYGTSNVRVIDLSVMPQQFVGHPQAFVYSIAEKGVDAIKADRR